MAARTLGKLIGAQVADRRRQRGLTQAELSEVADVTPETISRLERGVAMPSLLRLYDIANALGAELRDLLPSSKPSTKHQAIARLSTLAHTLSVEEVEALMRVAQALYLTTPGERAHIRKRRREP